MITEDTYLSVGRRLRSARLAAGEYNVSALIRRWERVRDPTYRATEDGRRRIRPDILALASQSFEVSERYLLEGTVSSPREELAAAISSLLVRFDSSGFGFHRNEDLSFRLRRARLAAGLRSPKAAADRFGWNAKRYADHESRHRGITFDQAIRYAQAFGMASAAELLFGAAPSAPTSEAMQVSMETDWLWLVGSSTHRGEVRWPCVVMSDGRFHLREPLVLPRMMAGAHQADRPIYCVIDGRERSAAEAYLTVPYLSDGSVLLFAKGHLERAARSSIEPTDPLTLDPSAGVSCIGTIVGTVKIEWNER